MHPIVQQLSKLRESSKEAVADSNSVIQDELKEYLHVEREIERILIGKIKKAATETGSPSLILVCGNVGDGKSHILSNLKKFDIHNDSTESFSPTKDCIETLDDVLNPFKDANQGNTAAKQIIAINLGTLSNFLAQKGKEYGRLKRYVEENNILDANEIQQNLKPDEIINHVNFTDYHLYVLTPEGGKSIIVEQLLDKIVAKTDDNPIYRAYLEIKEEAWSDRCIILANYEFLFEKPVRERIGNLILQLQVRLKQIISIRQMQRRYQLFKEQRRNTNRAAKNIVEYNKNEDVGLRRWIIVLDEYADLIEEDAENKKQIESLLKRLSQKARAAGIHVILATQKPSANIVSSSIKANLPGVLALHVKTDGDSRVVLDENGAETLAGNGDVLFKNGAGKVVRVQCAIDSNQLN